MRILIVEDDRKVGQFIERGLSELSYSGTWVRTCEAARDALAESTFDAIVLDLGLPDGDGLELLREWRSAGFDEPVLILSARDAVKDRITGLNLGADDYLAKPFSLEELIARLRALFRRQSGKKTTAFEHCGIKLDLLARTVEVDGKRVDLTSREFSLLELFMQNPGRVLTRTMIAEKIWDSHSDLDTNVLDVYMRRLRKKLEATPEKQYFKTLRGVGYEMI
jgi:two-component system copper resistance phosphate regulon response regulator CusR/two-component system response regulator QseB